MGVARRSQYRYGGALTLKFANRTQLDISQRDAIGRWLDAHPVDVLINAAAYTAVDQAEADAGPAMQINDAAVGTLAAECTQRGTRLVHLSTDYVFDGEKQEIGR